MKKIYSKFFLICIISMLTSTSSFSQIVISQVYGGGGNSGATYTNDFIEIFNRGTSSINITGWSVQYASATGTSWTKTDLTGTLAPGQYYLIQQGAGAGGTTPLPTPDATGNIAMASGSGKVALVNTTTLLSGSGCPFGSSIVDFVGFGSTASCSEGGTPTPAPSNTTAVLRNAFGCTDAGNNTADFTAGAPNPRNTSTTLNPCSGPPPPLTVSVSPGKDAAEPSTNGTFNITLSAAAPAGGITVTYNFSSGAGLAEFGTDFNNTPQNGSVTIAAGNSSAVVTVNVLDDFNIEGTEAIQINLLTATSPASINTSSATINLLDNDFPVVSPPIVINEVYGGGGNSGAFYRNDFIELYNNGSTPINLAGWSVQYASSTGTSWAVTSLTGTIPANGYFLIQEAGAATGFVALPTPDAIGTIAMSGTNGKVALVNSSTALSGACPTGAQIIDLVGYGSANCSETTPTPALSNTTSAQRKIKGVDTDNNFADFAVGTPTPFNSVVDIITPTLSNLTPADNAVNVFPSSTATIVFSENVEKGTGSILIKKISDNSTIQSIDVTTAAVTVAGKNVSFDFTSLNFTTSYYIQIDAGAFKDPSGNLFAGITDNTTWNFTTGAKVFGSLGTTYDFNTCSGSFPNGFSQYSITGSQKWVCTAFGRDPANPSASLPNGVQINGFASGINNTNEDWFISPSYNLTGTTFPLLSFWSRTAFTGEQLQLKISTDYPGTGDPGLYNWSDLNGKFPAQVSDIWTLSSNINLSDFKQGSIYIAFVYNSTIEDGARWTLDDFTIINSLTPPPPSITVSTSDIQFPYVASGSTNTKSFTIIGNDLVNDLTLSTSAPFEVSKDGIAFTPSISFTVTNDNNIARNVFVRFAPTQNNLNFSDIININTTGATATVNLAGTSIDPVTTLEVVNWNIEWFGSTTLGPVDDNLQETNVRTIMQNINADIFGLVEVVDESRLSRIVSQMPGYAYVISNYGSHTNTTVNPPSALAQAQKLAFVYKTSVISNLGTRALLSYTINSDETTSNPNYNNWASGRFPFMMDADVTLNCVTKNVKFILVHAKANTAPLQTSYDRRKRGADALRDSLDILFPESNLMIIGDFNDDLDVSITTGNITSSWSAFTTSSEYIPLTLPLSEAGKKSTVSYNDVIDHVVVSDEMNDFYMSGTASILTDVTSLVNKYGSTTTDHYPVFTRYIFRNTTAPSISCIAEATYCATTSNTYSVPAFIATDDCNDPIIYSYEITGATTRSGSSNDASGIFNTGTSIISWTATDSWGNSADCQTTVVVNPVPIVVIPDAFALQNGTLANTVYIGYAPASSITLSSNVSGGTPAYSYMWSSGSTNSTSTLSPTSTTTYTLTVTDANSCQASASKTIAVVDIRGGNKLDKVTICHKQNSLVVNDNAIIAHLNHGDMLGGCPLI
ncbi:MAG: lamin tail domain-containing protein, partial [Chitinophagaceae bacterium]